MFIVFLMVPEVGLEPTIDLLTLLKVLQTSSPPGLVSGIKLVVPLTGYDPVT